MASKEQNAQYFSEENQRKIREAQARQKKVESAVAAQNATVLNAPGKAKSGLRAAADALNLAIKRDKEKK